MTEDNRATGVAILACAGVLLTAVVLFLFYGISEPSSRSNTFLFTTWFSGGQVILLFAALVYTAIKDGRPDSVIPVNSATVVVAFIYNVVAVLTILVFTLALLPHRSSARTYYVVCIAELGIAIACAILLQLVAVAHRIGHSDAVARRITIDGLLKRCDIVSSNALMGGWALDISRCSEVIRFSDGLRLDSALSSKVDRLLSELEALTQAPPQDASIDNAKKLVSNIQAMAARRQ